MLVAAAVITFAAQTTLAGKEDSFYIKANGGYSKLNKVRSFKIGNFRGFKSEGAYFLGLGVGFYVMDNVRTDLIFDHFINPTHKGSRTRSSGTRWNHKVKAKIETLTFNGYVDLFDANVAKVFVGAGVGMAQVEAKHTFVGPLNDVRSLKYKKKNNFTYALHTGVSMEVAPGVSGELFYSYRDFGKTKINPAGDGSTKKYKGHHVGLGVRFDI